MQDKLNEQTALVIELVQKGVATLDDRLAGEQKLTDVINQGILTQIAEQSYVAIGALNESVILNGTNAKYSTYEKEVDTVIECLLAFCIQTEAFNRITKQS